MATVAAAPEHGLRYFRFLAAGNAISAYGTFLNMVALNLFAYQVTGSALYTGLFMALRLGSGFAAGFVAGGIVSRYSRKAVMIWASLAQAGAMVILLLTPTGIAGSVLYGVALVAGGGGTLAAVALRSAVPEIVGAGHRVRANGLLVTGRSVAMIAGFASAGPIIARFDYATVFAVDAATFAISAAILGSLPIRTNSAANANTGRPKPALLASHRAALASLRYRPTLSGLIVIRTVIGVAAAVANVSVPIYSSALDPAHPETFMGQFWTVWALGNVAAQLGLGHYAKRTGRSVGEWVFVTGACAMSAASIVVFTGWPLVLTIAAALVTGTASGVAEISYNSRLQATPDQQRGYLFGLSLTAENFGFGVGMVVAAVLLDRVGPLPVVATVAGIAIAAVLAFAVQLTRRAGAADRMDETDQTDENATAGPAAGVQRP